MKLIDELEKYFESYLQEEEEELDEMSTTASVPGYQTPYAFTGKKDKYEKRRKKSAETSTDNKIAKKFYEKNGMKRVGEIFWSKGTLPGDVYLYEDINKTIERFT